MTFPDDKNKRVSLKGCGKGLRLIFSKEGSDDEAIEEALSVLKKASSLISKSDIIIDVGSRHIGSSFVSSLFKDLIWPLSLKVSSWKGDGSETVKFFSSMGFKCFEKKKERSSTLVITKSLRSGQKVEHDGDVVVLGHVHDGSEVMADGNVFVFGRLRGLVHAGAMGDDNCFITTDCFMARQVRIGHKVSNELDPALQSWWKNPVIISISGDSFNVSKRS